MRRYKPLVLSILVLTLFECREPKTGFEKQLEKVDKLNLPINFNSKHGFDMRGINRDSIGTQALPYGRIFETNNIHTVIYLYSPVSDPVPWIMTMDKDGKKIDDLVAFKTTGPDYGYFSTEDVTILPDQSIVFVDSTETWDHDENGDEIMSSRKLKVTKEKYKIRDNGKIERVE